ncbi:MAG: uroporphyrinogen decarboxylase family protein [Promethearchaeota archaeon]
MNSIERVKAALKFEGPDKVPIMNFGMPNSDVFPLITMPSDDWKPGYAKDEEGLFPYNYAFPDFLKKWNENMPEWAKDNKYENWWKKPHLEIDEWGCIWEHGTIKTMGHPGRPSLPDWAKLDEYLDRYTPDPEDKSRYSFFLKLGKEFGKEKYRMALLGPFAPQWLASNMRGFENFMVDHALNPKKLEYLFEYLTDWFVKNMKCWIKYTDNGDKPHGFLIYDDLGTQDGPFISPKMFEKFYKPVYQTLYEAAHDLGCEFHQHTCGKIDRLIPYFIDWKLDALEFDSPRMSGYTDLKPYRGKIMFWGCVNIQTIYPNGTPEECEREVWHMMRNLGTRYGGFGAYLYPEPEQLGAPPANVRAFTRGLKKYGDYSKIPHHWWDYPTVEVWKDDVVPPLPSL